MLERMTYQEALEKLPQLDATNLPARLEGPVGLYIDISGAEHEARRMVHDVVIGTRVPVLKTLLGAWLEQRGLVVMNGNFSTVLKPKPSEKRIEVVDQKRRSNFEFWHYDHGINIAEEVRRACYSVLWCPDDPAQAAGKLTGPATAFGESGEVMGFVSQALHRFLEEAQQKPALKDVLKRISTAVQGGEVIPAEAYLLMREYKTPIDYIDPATLWQVYQQTLHLPSVVSHVIQPGETAFWHQQLLIHGRLPLQPGAKTVNTLFARDVFSDTPFRGETATEIHPKSA